MVRDDAGKRRQPIMNKSSCDGSSGCSKPAERLFHSCGGQVHASLIIIAPLLGCLASLSLTPFQCGRQAGRREGMRGERRRRSERCVRH